jgi:CheY-like chemotaxis protein/nitrogen-specific signal transduction histidine kinase/methylphosphotriester-DNA--protein-cysteine methyltransferase
LLFLFQVRRWELKRVNKKHALQLQLTEFNKLKELDQLKSKFFANISHEFRTPLTLIFGQLDSVQSPRLHEQDMGKLQVAYRNARRLLHLINELLDLSKLEAGGMELRAERHNLVSFLKNLVSSFESTAEQKNVTLNFSSEVDILIVKFEPEKMEKIFYNLLSNALKFTGKNGFVSVSIAQQQKHVKVIVTDSGIGISASELPHIFDRFYQVDDSQTREHEGSGIGLALAKELIELHGGQISVTSKEKVGTSFTVLLPALEIKERELEISSDLEHDLPKSDMKAEFHTPVSGAPSPSENEIILIVEDNTDVRAYIREQLEENYTIVEACDGQKGLDKALELIPDLIITDVMMPKMDGYQLSQHIRDDEKTSHIPIVMLTARADIDDKIAGLKTGVDSYLIKPFNARELKARIRNLIQQRRDLRERFREATIIKPSDVSVTPVDQLFLENVISSIENNFSNEDFSVESLASSVHMSVSQLNRKLGALIDQPGGQLIRSMRLQRAADLLKQDAATIVEICYQVGFSEQSTFTRAFKKQFGVSPREYKKTR